MLPGYAGKMQMGVDDSDPYFANVVYLAHMEGVNGSTTIVDSSPNPISVPVFGATKINTAASKFGASALDMNGQGNCYAQGTAEASLALPGDFTMECFVNIRGLVGSGDYCIMDLRAATGGTGPTLIHNSGYGISGQVNASIRWTGANGVTGVWRHCAITRASGTCRLFVDGSQVGSNYTFATAIGNGRVTFGKFVDANNGDAKLKLNGFIDEVRVTKGVARYTANFAPPSAEFPNR